MNSTDLVPVFAGELNGQTVQLVDARDLHTFLGVARDFSNWIKKRLKDGGFISNQDYVEVFAKSGENPLGGRPPIDYQLTLETAKHIAMMERNAKGHQVRTYFIECERRAHSRLQNLFTDELQSAINQEAHTLALRSFGPIRAALSELARQHLERGESPLEVVGRVRKGFPGVGDMLVIQAAELWQLTSALAGCAAAPEGPMDALHRLEARTGRDGYPK